MPSNLLPEFIKRLGSLEEKMEQHLLESITVHTKIGQVETHIYWLKWLVMLVVAGIFSLWLKG